MGRDRNTIWIDLENTPHIPFFAPIIERFERNGYRVVLTARDAYQTCEMAELYGLHYRKIGRHYGRRVFLKAFGLGTRALQLLAFALREKPILALSHGSRSQVVTCNLLRIPSVMIDDYEHSHGVGFGHPTWMLLPEALRSTGFAPYRKTELRYYAGIKEDVYVPSFSPNSAILQTLGLSPDNEVIVTVRPPATEAHYHNAESEGLFFRFMARALATPGIKIVLLPRNRRQEADLRARKAEWFANPRVVVPQKVVNGLDLLWFSDLVVSGGGTMNREAAALGLPVYSIFRGTIGAVDRQLEAENRLVLIRSLEDIDRKIQLTRRSKAQPATQKTRHALGDIISHLNDILSSLRPQPQAVLQTDSRA